MEESLPAILPAGDSAVTVEFGHDIRPAINRRVHALAAIVAHKNLRGLGEAVPAYGSLLVHYDPLLLDYRQVHAFLMECFNEPMEGHLQSGALVEIPVIYGGEFGPDLSNLARMRQLSESEVIQIHASRVYLVYMIGFTPGFPYLGEVDARITVPRLDSPRTRVPAGSVGIAGAQTGIYPIESPGGWQIIGRAQVDLFDLQRDPPSLLRPGDRVRFNAVEG